MAGNLKKLQSATAISPERKPLTKEKLRELSDVNLTDEEAEQVVDSIRLLAKILYEFTNQDKSICIDNQHVVNSEEQDFITQKQAA